MMTVFIAGPLFSESEQHFNQRIATICESIGLKTFLPQRDVGIVIHDEETDTFKHDLKYLINCDIVIANLDGIDVDSGTAWELGYAFSLNKFIIGIRTDVRSFRPFLNVNLMINQSCFKIVSSFRELKNLLTKYYQNEGNRKFRKTFNLALS